MQSPLATRCQQPIGRQQQQHLVPPRPLAARAQPPTPEPVELQLAQQAQRQPAPAPLARSAQPQFAQLQPDDRSIRLHPLAAVFRKQRQRARLRRPFLQDGDRLAPRPFLRIVDLAQVQQRPLHHTAPADPAILDDAPITVLLAVLLALGVAEKHDGCALYERPPSWKWPWSSLQRFLADFRLLTPCPSVTCGAKIPKPWGQPAKLG